MNKFTEVTTKKAANSVEGLKKEISLCISKATNTSEEAACIMREDSVASLLSDKSYQSYLEVAKQRCDWGDERSCEEIESYVQLTKIKHEQSNRSI